MSVETLHPAVEMRSQAYAGFEASDMMIRDRCPRKAVVVVWMTMTIRRKCRSDWDIIDVEALGKSSIASHQ